MEPKRLLERMPKMSVGNTEKTFAENPAREGVSLKSILLSLLARERRNHVEEGGLDRKA